MKILFLNIKYTKKKKFNVNIDIKVVLNTEKKIIKNILNKKYTFKNFYIKYIYIYKFINFYIKNINILIHNILKNNTHS